MGKTILVVEDNPLNVRLFKDVLEMNGYNVIVSEDGNDLINLITKCSPSLILLDIQLPVKSGVEWLRDIKKVPSISGIPIIALTAFAMDGDKDSFIKDGATDYLPKPIQVTTFIEMVKKYAGNAE